jgi:hypothetical protein
VRELELSVDLDALRARLKAMNDDELVNFGKEMTELVCPRTFGIYSKPKISAFSIQLSAARSEWRRRHPKNRKI